MPVDKTIPPKSCAIYKAAELINRAGPHQLVELFAAIDFGPPRNRQEKLDHAFGLGWLCEASGGLIAITDKTRRYFVDQEPKKQYIGQITPAPSWNVFASPGLSKKNIPNSRGTRRDIPDWSRRSPDFCAKSVAGGEA